MFDASSPNSESDRRSPTFHSSAARLAMTASATFLLVSLAPAGTPRLRVNGAVAPDNSAVAHAMIGQPLSLELRGTPNAKFSLMLALESTGVANGFYLKPSSGPSPLVPIHPVFDGIGSANLAAALGLPPSSIVNTTANPLFQLDGAGRFSFAGPTPIEAPLFDASNPGTPYVLPLESPASGPEIALFLQAVELDPVTGATHVGNGVRVVFDSIVLAADLALAIATPPSGGIPTIEIGTTNSLVTVADPDLNSPRSAPPAFAPQFSLSPNAIDVFRIELAGIEAPIAQSYWPLSNSPTNGVDPHTLPSHNYVTRLASGVDVGTGTRAVRNNENPQFPTIELPGNRALFHYRDRSGGAPRFGFGLHDGNTGAFHDLTPPAFGSFTVPSLGSPSPFDYEVLVNAACDRAFVVLEAGAAKDRLFLLDLVPGSSFSNGHSIVEIPLPSEVTEVFEESLDRIEAADGTEIAIFGTTNLATITLSTSPSHLRAVAFAEAATPAVVLPSSAAPTITFIGRIPAVSKDRSTAACIGGSNPFTTNLFSVRATSATNVVATQCTAFSTGGVAQWSNVSNGDAVPIAMTPDGSTIAFCRAEAANQRPYVTKADGSTAASLAPVAKYISEGGLFDGADFPVCRALQLSNDGKALVFALGFFLNGALADRFDVFAADLTTGSIQNLTRTIDGGSHLGPWDATGSLTVTRPTLEIGGAFASDDGDWFYFFRENRIGAPQPNRFDLVAISLAPPAGGGPPTFEVVNVTGDEFAPFFGAPVVPSSVASVHLGGSFINDVPVSATRLRRFAPTNPLAGQYAFTALRTPSSGSEQTVVIAFDPTDPHSARELATFSVPGASIAPRVAQFVLDPRATRAAVVLRSPSFTGAPAGPGQRQDLYLIDMLAPAPPSLVTAGSFVTEITAGSVRFRSAFPDGIFFGAGTTTTIQILYDNVMESDFAPNPIDANLYFRRFALGASIPAQTNAILPPGAPGSDRAVHLWSVR